MLWRIWRPPRPPKGTLRPRERCSKRQSSSIANEVSNRNLRGDLPAWAISILLRENWTKPLAAITTPYRLEQNLARKPRLLKASWLSLPWHSNENNQLRRKAE